LSPYRPWAAARFIGFSENSQAAPVGSCACNDSTGGLEARPHDRRLVLLARAGGAALLAGVVLGSVRWLADGGLDGDGASGIATTLYFLVGGALFTALAGRGRLLVARSL
jgi:hypothetical protein